MLPKEGLRDVNRYLPRCYLDTILTSNSAVYASILTSSEPHDTNGAPRRCVRLEVAAMQGGSINFTFTRGSRAGSYEPDNVPMQVFCRSAQSFRTAARDCFVTVMHIDVMRPILFSILMNEAHRWELGGMLEDHPPHFPSRNDFHRFFDELVVTQGKLKFDISRNLPFAIESPRFWGFEAVRRCQWLAVDHIPPQMERPFTAAMVLQWLSIPPSTAPYKQLHFHESMLGETMVQFQGGLLNDFLTASTPNRYQIRIRLQSVVLTEPIPFLNDVNELLFVTTEEGGDYLEVHARPAS